MTVIFFFTPSEETLPTPIRETLSLCDLQKHKHMPKEFRGNNLASCFKLGGLLYEEREAPHNPLFFQDFSKELRDPLLLTQHHQHQAAVEECCYISSSLFDAAEMCCAEQMKGLGVLQQLLRTSLNRAVARGGLAFGWYFWVHLQKHKSTFCRQ